MTYDPLSFGNGHGEPPSPPKLGTAWMLTFGDLVSLMLTFFVMMFAMSSVKIGQWESIIDALSQSLGPPDKKSVPVATARYNIATVFRKRAVNLDYLAAVIEEAVRHQPILSGSRLIRLEDALVIALPGDLLFGAGKAVLSEHASDALFHLGGVLRNVGNRIGVNGHSDSTPPEAGTYQSNWELSLARAVAVANALRRAGYPDEISAFGYSDTRFSELPDLPDEKRRALARRVDIVVMPVLGGG